MTYPSIQQGHPRVTGEQIEEGPEGEMGEQKSISHLDSWVYGHTSGLVEWKPNKAERGSDNVNVW